MGIPVSCTHVGTWCLRIFFPVFFNLMIKKENLIVLIRRSLIPNVTELFSNVYWSFQLFLCDLGNPFIYKILLRELWKAWDFGKYFFLGNYTYKLP